MTSSSLDAIVVGSGPNGLAAAITLARAGRSVRVYEAEDTIGGGLRSAPLTNPGFVHDRCAAVMALVGGSPFLKSLPLAQRGFEPAYPEAPFAHPLDDGSAVVAERSVDATAAALETEDARAYRDLFGWFTAEADALLDGLLRGPSLRHPGLMAAFGVKAIRTASSFARSTFRTERARALVAGAAAHAAVPLEWRATAGYALGLMITAHAWHWPIARGGSQRLADAMAAHLKSLGGEIVTGHRVESLAALPQARAVLFDVTPRQLIAIAGDRLPAGYRADLARYRHGPGVFKMDWALHSPVPWRAAGCARAGTLHLGGTELEIAAAELDVWRDRHPDRPYVLVVQPSLFDSSRAPGGKHTLWAYSHVPNGSTVDMTDRIEAQIERFAPGFRDCIAGRHVMFPADLERHNANLAGGDIAGGAADLAQIFARPVAAWNPHVTPVPGLYLCSSSTPPGVGIHGMCGYRAATAALRRSFGSGRAG